MAREFALVVTEEASPEQRGRLAPLHLHLQKDRQSQSFGESGSGLNNGRHLIAVSAIAYIQEAIGTSSTPALRLLPTVQLPPAIRSLPGIKLLLAIYLALARHLASPHYLAPARSLPPARHRCTWASPSLPA
jgi:hypothetical protein